MTAAANVYVSSGILVSWNNSDVGMIVDANDSMDPNALDATVQTSYGMKDRIAGLKEGDVELDLWWDQTDTAHLALYTDMLAGTQRTLVISAIPDAVDGTSTYTLTALCTKIDPKEHLGDGRKATVSFKIQGIPSGAEIGMSGSPTPT